MNRVKGHDGSLENSDSYMAAIRIGNTASILILVTAEMLLQRIKANPQNVSSCEKYYL